MCTLGTFVIAEAWQLLRVSRPQTEVSVIDRTAAVAREPVSLPQQSHADQKSSVIRWSGQPDAWRLRGIRLRLHAATVQSVALRTIVRHERFERECARLEQLRRTLIEDGTHCRHDPVAAQRLAVHIATFYQQVGTLERNVASVFEELSEFSDQKAMRP